MFLLSLIALYDLIGYIASSRIVLFDLLSHLFYFCSGSELHLVDRMSLEELFIFLHEVFVIESSIMECLEDSLGSEDNLWFFCD
jgi:hypothetical protein